MASSIELLTNAVDGKVEKQLGGLSFTRLQFALKIDHFDHICNKKMMGMERELVSRIHSDSFDDIYLSTRSKSFLESWGTTFLPD